MASSDIVEDRFLTVSLGERILVSMLFEQCETLGEIKAGHGC